MGRQGFSLEEHELVGRELNQVLDTLTSLSNRLAARYGQRGHTGYHTGHQLQKAKTALLQVRQTLEGTLEKEYPFAFNENYYKTTVMSQAKATVQG